MFGVSFGLGLPIAGQAGAGSSLMLFGRKFVFAGDSITQNGGVGGSTPCEATVRFGRVEFVDVT